MRLLTGIFLISSAVGAKAQDVQAVFKQATLPGGLTVSVRKVTGKLPGYKTEFSALARFEYNGRGVDYFVFTCKPPCAIEDTMQLSYVAYSNCNVVFHKDYRKNLPSFQKGSYLFLLQLCPCRTTESEDCANLAMKLNQWSQQERW